MYQTLAVNAIENDFIGKKEKLNYLMDIGVNFGRDTGLSMYYFSQRQGVRASSALAGEGLIRITVNSI